MEMFAPLTEWRPIGRHSRPTTNRTPMSIQLGMFSPQLWQRYRDLRLRALRDSPDAFGSTYAAEAALPDAWWQARLSSASTSGADLPLLALVDGDHAGLAWVQLAPEASQIANLYQMWVAPEFRGHGVGRMLLEAAADWARSAGATELRLGVTIGDSPAFRLYSRAGFLPIGPPAPLRRDSPLLAQDMRLDLGGA